MDELKRLNELLNAKTVEMEALLGDDEARDTPLSDDEQKHLGALDAECDKLKADIDDLKARLEKRAELRRKQDARKRSLATQPERPRTPPDTPGGLATAGTAETTTRGNGQADRLETLTRILPDRGHQLQNFKGPNARYEAYVSGCWLFSLIGGALKARNVPVGGAVDQATTFCHEHLAMDSSAHTAGGALVPDEFVRTVMNLMQQYGTARQEARVESMSTEVKTVPVATSGLTAYAVSPGSDITESDAAWKDYNLTARDWGVMCRYSSRLSDDAFVSMADTLAAEAAWAFAKKEDECAFLGDGTATYHGISGLITTVAATAAAKVTAAAGNLAFGSLDLTDFENMVGALAEYATANAKWYISKVGWARSMLRLIEAAGGQTGEMITGKIQPYFLGYPVVVTQAMNRTTSDQTSTDGLCYLGDLKLGMLLGDRMDFEMLLSLERYIEKAQIGIRFLRRNDVIVTNIGGRTDDSSDNGPVIVLSTPAA